jgi:hypothetical protein
MLKHCLYKCSDKAHSYRLYADRGSRPIEFDKSNLQNIPTDEDKNQKSIYCAMKIILSADYSQIELRIIAA